MTDLAWLGADASDSELDAVARLWDRHHAEVGVDVPTCTSDEVRARLLVGWDGEPERVGVLRTAAGEAVLTAFLPCREDGDLAVVGCFPSGGHDRAEVVRAGLRVLVDDVVAAGRRRVLTESWDHQPDHGALLRGLGFRPVHQQVLLRRELGDEVGAPPAGRVVVEHHVGPSPDALLHELGEVANAIGDAPTGDASFAPVEHTAARLRAWEAGQQLRGHHVHRVVARDPDDGRLVGHSVVTVAGRLALQHDTAVLADRRGGGVGASLKAAVLDAVGSSAPGVRRIQTWCSADNAPILRLNARFGFVEAASATGWQLDVD